MTDFVATLDLEFKPKKPLALGVEKNELLTRLRQAETKFFQFWQNVIDEALSISNNDPQLDQQIYKARDACKEAIKYCEICILTNEELYIPDSLEAAQDTLVSFVNFLALIFAQSKREIPASLNEDEIDSIYLLELWEFYKDFYDYSHHDSWNIPSYLSFPDDQQKDAVFDSRLYRESISALKPSFDLSALKHNTRH